MGNEMGNNNTSGLREEDKTVEDKSVQEFGHADDLNEQNVVVPETQGKVSQGKEDPNVHDQKTENKEEDNMKTEGKKSLEDTAPTDNDNKKENHEVPASEDTYVNEKGTGLPSIDLEGVAEPQDDNQKPDEKEEDDSMIPVDKEKTLQEAGYAEEAEGQDHLVPAAEDKNTHGNETELASREHDGLASPRTEDQNQDEKEQDINKIPEVEETPLQEAASADETNAEAHVVPAGGDGDTHGTETGLVLSDGDGMAHPCVDKQKHDEKEEGGNINDEAKQSSQEAASTDVLDRQGDQLAVVENKTTHGNETALVSIDPEGTADNINDEAEEQSSQEAASTDVLDRQGDQLAGVENKTSHGNETGLVSIDPEGTADPHGNNPKDHDETGMVSIDPEGTASPHGNNPKDHAKDENNTNSERQEKPLAKDDDHEVDIEEKNLTIPGAEGEDYTNTEEERASSDLVLVGDTLYNQTLEGQDQGKTELQPPAESTEADAKPREVVGEGTETQPASSSKNLEDHEIQKKSNFEENLSRRTHHFENQNSMMEAEDEGTSNSISGAASSTSHDFVPQEPAVLEPEDHELAKSDTEQLVLECNGPLKSEDMIIPSFTCGDQENSFILDSSISTDLIESVFPDQSPEVGMEGDVFKVKDMAIKEVSSEEKFELKDGGEAGNNFETITTIMTDLPMGFEAKCNGELPSEMNSTKNDSPESQVEAILSDKTVQNILVKVSESEDNGIVLSRNAASVKEESENGNSKHSHCQIQSGEDSIEKSNGQGSREGSKADYLNDFQPLCMMNGHQKEKQICLLDTSCDSKNRDKDCQFLQAKILDDGHLADASINFQKQAPEEQQKDSQKVQLITDSIVITADTFVTDQIYKEEESEEKKIVEEMVEKKKDSNPIENDGSPTRENGQRCISRSYPIEQAETFVSPSPFLHEKQQQDSYLECKKVQNINECMAEVKQESSGEFAIIESSSFVTKNLTEKTVVSIVGFAGEEPLWDLSECPKSTDPVTMAETKPSVKQSGEQCAIGETQTPEVIAKGDYYQRETVGRFSIESNPDNSTIHAQMRKSPSFDLDLRIDARAEDSDQTPLLYQDKTTIESFSSEADATDRGKPVANSEYGENPSQYESMAAQEKVVTLERSDSDKSKTPFLGFLKQHEEADQMLINPKKQDNQSATKKTTNISTKDVTSATTKGKEKRKPRASLFGTCMCCATVAN